MNAPLRNPAAQTFLNSCPHHGGMTQAAQFGRRGVAAPKKNAAPAIMSCDVALTPEQRAHLLGDDKASSGARNNGATPAHEAAPWSRWAGFAACAAATCVVAALTLIGHPQHDSIAAMPTALEPAAKGLLKGAGGGWFEPLSLAWSIFVISSNLAFNLWLTHKFCNMKRFRGLAAYGLTGAAISAGLAFATAMLGLGDSEIGYSMEALSGGGAAVLYRLLSSGSWRKR